MSNCESGKLPCRSRSATPDGATSPSLLSADQKTFEIMDLMATEPHTIFEMSPPHKSPRRSRSVTPNGATSPSLLTADQKTFEIMDLMVTEPRTISEMSTPHKSPRHSRSATPDRAPSTSPSILSTDQKTFQIMDLMVSEPRTISEMSPPRSDVAERVEALDMPGEVTEAYLITVPWHIQDWVGDLPGRDTAKIMDSAEPGPSKATVTKVPKRVKRVPKRVKKDPSLDGSDIDSESDDNFNVDEAGLAGAGNNIPDTEDLEEPIQQLVDDINTGMDEAANRLLDTATSFDWTEDFATFRAVREEFTGPTPGPVKDYDTPYDAFVDIWDKDIMGLIASETNRYAKQTIEDKRSAGDLTPSSRLLSWSDTNIDEIMVFLATMMFMGIDSRTSMSEYWTKNKILRLPGFTQLMSYSRFILLNKFIHFVDNKVIESQQLSQDEDDCSIRQSDKLRKLEPIIVHLEKKFKSLYHLEPNICIDESLTLFKGRLSWVQTIKTKAARFGIKSYELCESRTGYMAGIKIYTGKYNSSGGTSLGVDLGGKTTKVVLDLLRGLEHRGHCIVMDNFYNCPALSRYLKTLGFDSVGTLRVSRRHVPSDIANAPKVSKGTIIARHCGDVSIIAWMSTKMVNIISTFHKPDYTGPWHSKQPVKPECVKDYNRSMGGVDLKDQKLSMYLLERKRGIKWYVKMFKRLLNVSIHNALVMYVSSKKRRGELPMTQREFRYRLAEDLVKRHRNSLPTVVKSVPDQMRLRRDIVHEPQHLKGQENRKRCVMCYRMKKNKMIHTKCVQCDVYICFEECWRIWHSLAILPELDTRGRKRIRTK